MPGENTDSWRACWREISSGEAEKKQRFRIRKLQSIVVPLESTGFTVLLLTFTVTEFLLDIVHFQVFWNRSRPGGNTNHTL